PERGRDDGQDQDAAAAVEDPAQHVLTEVVRPQHRRAARVRIGRADRGARAVRRDVGPDDRQQHEEADKRDADTGPPQPQRSAQQGCAPDPGRRQWQLRAGDDGAAHLAHSRVLSLGVTRIVATSASRLRITYTAAMSMASAWMTGRSWLTTDSWIALPMPV